MGPNEDRPRLILGLGNPGARYEDSRHNLGFRVVDELVGRLHAGTGRLDCNALVATVAGALLAKPMTYMNRSGYAARCLMERHELKREDLLVVYDDVWLPLARLRARPRGGAGGHRGMESILHNLRTEEIQRLRLGVGWEGGPPEDVDLVEYVLEPFPEDQSGTVDEMVGRAADACRCWLRDGIGATMDRFNG